MRYIYIIGTFMKLSSAKLNRVAREQELYLMSSRKLRIPAVLGGLIRLWFAFINQDQLILLSKLALYRQRLRSIRVCLSFSARIAERNILSGGRIVYSYSHKSLSWSSVPQSLSRYRLSLLFGICYNGFTPRKLPFLFGEMSAKSF